MAEYLNVILWPMQTEQLEDDADYLNVCKRLERDTQVDIPSPSSGDQLMPLLQYKSTKIVKMTYTEC